MKKLLLATCVSLAAAMASNAQITLEHEYITPNTMQVHKMSNGDVKLLEFPIGSANTRTINVYNSDHSLYKTINLAPNVNDSTSYGVQHVSDHLFNSDNKLEFVGSIVNNYKLISKVVIYNEDTAILLSLDSTVFNSIYKDATGYKMLIHHRSKSSPSLPAIQNKMLVYSLPGTLPLMVKPVEPANKPLNIADPFPNPAVNEKVIIPYALPEGTDRGDIIFTDLNGREVKTFTVTNTFNTLELDGQLPHGTYFYQLKAGSVTTGAKKLIIIK